MKTAKPNPNLIKFLSRKFSDSFTNLVIVNPSPKVITKNTIIVITDPMLATGGSLLHVLKRLQDMSPKEIRVVAVISAPEGIEAVQKEFPYVQIFTAAVDEKLNDQKFIVPGLGDYGDRYFGTG